MMMESKEELRKISKGEKELMLFDEEIEKLSEDEDIIGLYDKEAMDEFVNRLNREAEIKETAEKSLAEGIEQGKAEGQANIIIKMKKANMSNDEIARITGFSVSEIEEMQE